MSAVRTRALTITAAAGTALALAVAPASAADGNSLTAGDPGSARIAGEVRSGTLDAPQEIEGEARAGVGFRVDNLRCGPGNVVFDADTWENGRSGVQRFRQKAQLQEFVGRWVNRSPVNVATSTKFPNDIRSFHFDRQWNGAHVANGASWRVKWQGQYLNGFGQVIAQTKIITATCF